jgi:WhiB family redox-sensing transcriptional regulator
VRLREKKAKAICGQCPVIANCLRDALANNEPFGIWGGMSPDERYRLANNLGA